MWLQARNKFRVIQDGTGQVGHTHNHQDQRFSILATAWAKQKNLETPSDFLDIIALEVMSFENRVLVVGRLHGVFDWQAFFSVLDFKM